VGTDGRGVVGRQTRVCRPVLLVRRAGRRLQPRLDRVGAAAGAWRDPRSRGWRVPVRPRQAAVMAIARWRGPPGSPMIIV